MSAYRTIDPKDLDRHFDSPAAEARWDARWAELRIHHYDPARPRAETFVVDTPPPTVSGSLHIGHCFSYTHTDVIVRQRRMLGLNIFYPMGWDDNGLPTERRVQNYFHVRCDPNLPYEPGLALPEANAKQRKDPPRFVSRPNFIELCNSLTREDEKRYLALWRRLGLSVDWTQEYSTVGDHCRKISQASFLDLHAKGWLYSSDAPTLWDVDFQTAVAQAELEDRELQSHFNDIAFGVENSDEEFVISTTRPELLPACVAVAAHPDDARYKHLFGKRAVTPLFRVPVKIFPSELADPEKGTGILMICTFGDQTDVQWWREQSLPLRQVIGRSGRLNEVVFGSAGWESLDAAKANAHYAELAGKRPEQARKRILEMLAEPGTGAVGNAAPLRSQRAIKHAVKFYEKGDRPLEFVPTRQWFCRLLDKKPALLEKGAEVQWHPQFMGARYAMWTEGLQFDWCVSRQRYFGVPLPLWYPLDDRGAPNYEAPIVAEASQLPVDPMVSPPPGRREEERGKPGGFVGDADVFDTWFTSSMTPQVSSYWGVDPERHAKLFPADMRPQAHEIIRTWAFYTIAKALAHENTVPWGHAVISGWVVQRNESGKGEKISKSKEDQGGAIVRPAEKPKPIPPPHELLDTYTADGVRYWAANARLGVDTTFDDKVLAQGKRLVTKIFNASKFVLGQTAEPGPIVAELDRGFLHELQAVVAETTASFAEFEFAPALKATEGFFWARFTDSYVELAKVRARAEDDPAGRASAVAALRRGLSVLLRLFAPVLPYITEEVWSWAFGPEYASSTVHTAGWPGPADFADVPAPEIAGSFAVAVEALAAINRAKTSAGVGIGRGALSLELAANPETLRRLGPVLADVLAAGRIRTHTLTENRPATDGEIQVRAVEFEPKPPK